MRRLMELMGVDGLLHSLASGFIVLASLILTCNIYVGVILALLAGIIKEAWDLFIQKDNTWKQAGHDIVCDLAGIAIAMVIYFSQLIIY